jgi:hypothetical protein
MRLPKRSLTIIASSLAVVALASGALASHAPTSHADALEPDQVTTSALANATAKDGTNIPQLQHANGHVAHGIPNIDSLVNFSGKYHADGFEPNGLANKQWLYNTVGNLPQHGGTTVINAPIVPVAIDLRNYDGSPRFVGSHRLIYDPMQYVTPVLNSPVFSNASYSSSDTPTQFSDAIQRAEYAKSAKPDWHTLLAPSVKTERTMVLIRGTYRFALNADGTCCAFVLVDANTFANALFPTTVPVDASTPVGAAELAGDITTKDISTFLFLNTFLYFNGDLTVCCTTGFHSYDLEPGDASNGNRERRYVLNYSSWVTPRVFGDDNTGSQDVATLSHEITETYNDPFVTSDNAHNITPWWLAPNGICQDNLETGDVIEILPNRSFPITMNGMTYHPQNEALLQWFEGMTPSDATGGAYSYPDTSVLPTANPANTPLNCGQ